MERDQRGAIQCRGGPEQDDLAVRAQGAQVADEWDRWPGGEVSVHEQHRGVASCQDAERLRRIDVADDVHNGQWGQGIAQRIPLTMRGADEYER